MKKQELLFKKVTTLMKVQGSNLGRKPGKLFFPGIHQRFLKTVKLDLKFSRVFVTIYQVM